MIGYILQNKQQFSGALELKGFSMKPAGNFFIEDRIDTIREVKLKNDPKIYYVLSFERGKPMPPSIVGKYSEVGQNPNRILSADEMRQYLLDNEDFESDFYK